MGSPFCVSPTCHGILFSFSSDEPSHDSQPFDAHPDRLLLATQGVRALPSFHFWKGSKQVDSISGAKAQTLQDAIETHMN